MPKTNLLIRIVFAVSVICAVMMVVAIVGSNRKDILLLALLSFSGFALTLHLLYKTLIVPLNQTAKSFDKESSDYNLPLLKQNSRFSKNAALIDNTSEESASLVFQVDERTKAERVFLKSEQLYRSVVETSADAVVIIDHTGHIQFYNSTASILFAIELVKNKRLHCLRFITPQELKIVIHQCNTSTQKLIRNVECTLKRSDQKFFPAEISVSSIQYPDSDHDWHVVICTDISKRKIMEFEKSRMEEQLKIAHKMEAIGQLASGIAHDFNNVLGAIFGYADIIRQRYSMDEKLNKYAQMIMSGSSRASELTNKLLTFSRRNKLHFSTIDIHNLLQDIMDLLKHTISKDISIECTLNATDPVINGDISQIQNMITEIALNASHAMEDHGGCLKIKTDDYYIDESFSKDKVYAISPGQYIKISVQDNGIGISKKIAARIFEPFFTTKSKGIGTGLGLATVYGSVKSHHGYIDVESTQGEGATFSIYMPSVANDGTGEIASKESGSVNFSNVTKSILIIDDEVFLCNALKEMLGWMGYAVRSFCDSFEAVEFYSHNSTDFELVILDLMMPGLNGFEAYKMLKEINPQIRVIISSGYCLETDRQKLLRMGANYILQKPFVSSQLSDALQKVLG